MTKYNKAHILYYNLYYIAVKYNKSHIVHNLYILLQNFFAKFNIVVKWPQARLLISAIISIIESMITFKDIVIDHMHKFGTDT